MMTCTENCPHWAQWKVSAPEKDGDGKIRGFRTVALLCGQHKNIMEKMVRESDLATDLRFNFVGAVPDGSYSPQH